MCLCFFLALKECKSRALIDVADFEKLLDKDVNDDLPVNVDMVPDPQPGMVSHREQYSTRSPTPYPSQTPSCDVSVISLSPSTSVPSPALLDFENALDMNIDNSMLLTMGPASVHSQDATMEDLSTFVTIDTPLPAPALDVSEVSTADSSFDVPDPNTTLPISAAYTSVSTTVAATYDIPSSSLLPMSVVKNPTSPDVHASTSVNDTQTSAASTTALDVDQASSFLLPTPVVENPTSTPEVHGSAGENDIQTPAASKPSGKIRTRRHGQIDSDTITVPCPPTIPSKCTNMDMAASSNLVMSKRPRTLSKPSVSSTATSAEALSHTKFVS